MAHVWVGSVPQRVQEAHRSAVPDPTCREGLEPETSNIGYLDPLANIPKPSVHL